MKLRKSWVIVLINSQKTARCLVYCILNRRSRQSPQLSCWGDRTRRFICRLWALLEVEGVLWLEFNVQINCRYDFVYLSPSTSGAQCTGWRRCIGCFNLQVSFRKRATNYRALMQKIMYKNQVSYESSPPCTVRHLYTTGWRRLIGCLIFIRSFHRVPYLYT